MRKSRGEQAVNTTRIKGTRLNLLRTIECALKQISFRRGQPGGVPITFGRTPCQMFLATCDCKQTRALVWKERLRGDLTIEPGSPTAGNLRGALRAMAVRRQVVVLDQIAVTANQCLATIWAMSVFPVAHHARQVPWIDITQARLPPDLGRAEKIFRRGVARIIASCSRHETRSRATEYPAKYWLRIRSAPQFILGIVKPGINRVTISSHRPRHGCGECCRGSDRCARPVRDNDGRQSSSDQLYTDRAKAVEIRAPAGSHCRSKRIQ